MSVVVAVPFRPQEGMDRAGQLEVLLDRLLPDPGLTVVVAEQEPGLPFHRGALLNAAFVHAVRDDTTAFVAQDCDLVPDDAMLRLYTAEARPFFCLAGVGTRYSAAPTFAGGVTMFTPESFRRMNGFPVDDAYGWGGEDDAVRWRLGQCGVPLERNTRVGTFRDLEDMDLATKLAWLRARPGQKNQRKWELRDRDRDHWRENGLEGPRQPVARAVPGRRCAWIRVEVPAPP